MRGRWAGRCGVLAAAIALPTVLLSATPALADTFPVTTGADSGPGSLRDAITSANSNGDALVDQIPIQVAAVELLTGLPNVTTATTISGTGASSVHIRRAASATTSFRFLAVTPLNATDTVTIESLSMSGAQASGFAGGALAMSGPGTLVLDSVVLRNNQSGQGGALFYDKGFTSIRNSTLTDNEAAFGGAILASKFGTEVGNGEVVNSTISGNRATDFGGGIYTNVSHIQILSSTIVGNVGGSDGTGGGGGTYNGAADAAAFSVANTLYAGNKVGTTTPVDSQCGGAHTSFGYNLRETSEVDCTGFTSTGDVVNANPMIGSLGPNGGPTPTIALLADSPAIDAGNPATPGSGAFPICPATDQRGFFRTGAAGRCDIGAFERNAPATPPTCGGKQVTISGTAASDTLVGTSAADVIDGAGDNDKIRGLGGNDTICGDHGRDRLIGGAGNDKLLGGAGKDTLKGGKGRDKLKGGPGRDTLKGGPGRDKEVQ